MSARWPSLVSFTHSVGGSGPIRTRCSRLPHLIPTLLPGAPPGVGLPPLPGTPGFADRLPSYKSWYSSSQRARSSAPRTRSGPTSTSRASHPCPEQPGGQYLYNPRNDTWFCNRLPTRFQNRRIRPQPTTAQAICLISCLIHLRPAPFIGDRPGRIRARHGRWRTPVNACAHCWKACWGQPLASSNLASSARLSCDDAFRPGSPAVPSPERMSHFLSQLTPRHMSHSGQIDLAAELDDSRCASSGTSRTRMNRAAHAA